MLDQRGIIAAVQIATYGPFICIGPFLAIRDSDRRMGWSGLTVMSVLRTIGGITHLLSENDPTNVAERTLFAVAEGAGQGPLLLATIGFLRTVTQYAINETLWFSKGVWVIAIVTITAVALAIAGAVKTAIATTEDELDFSIKLRRVGIILFLIVFSFMLVSACLCWATWRRILRYRRRLLIAISATIPFLLVRVLYAALATWAPVTTAIRDGHHVTLPQSNSGLGKFSGTSSEWGIYLVMSVLTEYVAVIIFLAAGALVPIKKEVVPYTKGEKNWSSEDVLKNERVTVSKA